MKYKYPAVFKWDGNFYSICFPDLESYGCHTHAKSLIGALGRAWSTLCLTLYNLENTEVDIPKASNLKDERISENEFVWLIDCDTDEYRKKIYTYPAVFRQNQDGCYTITFPDFPIYLIKCTERKNLRDTCEQTLEQLIKSLLDKNQEIPRASLHENLNLNENEFAIDVKVKI